MNDDRYSLCVVQLAYW